MNTKYLYRFVKASNGIEGHERFLNLAELQVKESPGWDPDRGARCPSGVARVVTEHSFVNGVAAFITGGIYTPMHITVTCAAGTAALDVPTVRSLAEARARVDAGEDFLLPMGRGPNSE